MTTLPALSSQLLNVKTKWKNRIFENNDQILKPPSRVANSFKGSDRGKWNTSFIQIDIMGCNIWMLNFKFNWIFTIWVVLLNSVNLYGSYVLRYQLFLVLFTLYTQQTKVKLEAIDIEFNSISAYTPFHFSRTLHNI